jgi:ABC-type Na+ efflux pump permease subunit
VSETARQSAGDTAGGRSAGRVIAAAVLVVIGILLIVATIIYFTTAAKSLPSILGTIKHPVGRANSKRPLHGIATLVVAVVCFAGAYFAYAWKTRGAKDA